MHLSTITYYSLSYVIMLKIYIYIDFSRIKVELIKKIAKITSSSTNCFITKHQLYTFILYTNMSKIRSQFDFPPSMYYWSWRSKEWRRQNLQEKERKEKAPKDTVMIKFHSLSFLHLQMVSTRCLWLPELWVPSEMDFLSRIWLSSLDNLSIPFPTLCILNLFCMKSDR